MPEILGRYRVTGPLGEGGMGVVYAAHDRLLNRAVAIKMIREAGADAPARARLLREARACASVNHPNVCQVYEVGEEDDQVFIVMERLQGESLASRVRRGPLPLSEAVSVTLAILAALEALHQRGLVHRDLKPSNVFLTPHGVKLLDFGLARPMQSSVADTRTAVTSSGLAAGTPQYMAPEQFVDPSVDARADVFAAAATLFEMLAGKPAFAGPTLVQVMHAVLYTHPPALAGSSAIIAVDRVIHRGLMKKPEDRYQHVVAMADDLRATVHPGSSSDIPARARPMTRLIVLPFRLLRADPDVEFLAFSLPDAVSDSLSGLESLIVRSTLAGARFATDDVDFTRIAEEAGVDIVLTGTVLRAGDQLRVTSQLVEAPGGTVIWSQRSQVPLGDVFQLQDDLARRIVDSLSIPLTARDHRMLRHDVPASAKAYEFYLRANQLALDARHWLVARDVYLRGLDEDPRYAPAWARLGRIYRVIGKYGEQDVRENLALAEDAFTRALSINPDLSLAHNQYAQLEADLGRAGDALLRLVARARASRSDPELFAGLVHVCRFAGLFDASIAAHHLARRLDPQIRTSVTHTYFMLGDYRRSIETSAGDIGYIEPLALTALGRQAEALDLVKQREHTDGLHPLIALYLASLRALLEGDITACVSAVERTVAHPPLGPEELYYCARTLAWVGEPTRALSVLERAVDRGLACFTALVRDPWLDAIRTMPEFASISRRTETRHRETADAFIQAGGDTVLGLSARDRQGGAV
jgi:serine/threonine protein kinase/tetratricopeptide (TPR) repeat protein